MTATSNLHLYRDALERWQRTLKSHPYDPTNLEPVPKDYSVDDWAAKAVKEQVVREFGRTF